VLLVVAVCLFAYDRPYLAAVNVALAATFHSTYLLVAALLTLGFLCSLWVEGRRRQAFAVGGLTIALVVPILVHVLIGFRPTSSEAFAEAQEILANFRIPHHARVDYWLDSVAALQIAWVVVAVVVVWRTRLFVVLAIPFVLAALLTLVQVATGSHTLALLFPWRVSAVLVPVATMIILMRLVSVSSLPLEGPIVRGVSVVIVARLVGRGVWIMASRQAFHTSDEELGVLAFVRRNKDSGDIYFLPVQVPDRSKKTRGSLSSDFEPLGEKRQDKRVIPYDFQRFRLLSGAPLFIDFKSVPYRDDEVLAWRARIRVAQEVQEKLDPGRVSEALAELRGHDITHLVLQANRKLRVPGLKEVYADKYYRVYQLIPSRKSRQRSGRAGKGEVRLSRVTRSG